MQNLIILGDKEVLAIVKDARCRQILPCLAGPFGRLKLIKPGDPNCIPCEHKRAREAATILQTAKQCILNTKGERRQQLKDHLKTKQLRIKIVVGGQLKTYTF